MDLKQLLMLFPVLKEMEQKEVFFNSEKSISLAASIVHTGLPYRPGVYLVYNYTNNKLNDLLYVGMAGADKSGNINSHQLPKRLLAVCYPPERYIKGLSKKHLSRNEIWPKMMRADDITDIKIFCFFSKINDDYKVSHEHNPLSIEKNILKHLKVNTYSLAWSKKNN